MSAAPRFPVPKMRDVVGVCDIVLLTLDTLRYDVAARLLAEGRTPNLSAHLGPGGWEPRHTPGSFTYAAHHAFFAGFLPTPVRDSAAERLFAARFLGSETTGANTYVFDAPDIVSGLAGRGYHTLCVGGVGFFSKQTALGSTLPNLFAESHWQPEFGVTAPGCVDAQREWITTRLAALPPERRLFLFVNIAAMHQPNFHYLPGDHPRPQPQDTLESHGAALEYVDGALPPLLGALSRRAPLFVIVCSDHGTCYGEDGRQGHRFAHEAVWTVPYGHFFVPQATS